MTPPAQPESIEDKIRFRLAIDIPELSITRTERMVNSIMGIIAESRPAPAAPDALNTLIELEQRMTIAYRKSGLTNHDRGIIDGIGLAISELRQHQSQQEREER